MICLDPNSNRHALAFSKLINAAGERQASAKFMTGM